MVFGLPYRQVWAMDFEFIAQPGERPHPVCMVARELGTGQLIQYWQGEFASSPPFDVGPESLFVAYLASAELGCFLQLGWPLPVRIVDLYVEFRRETNGLSLPAGRGLLGALSHHGISAITSEEKHEMRDLVLRGGPWSPAEQRAILDYCRSDVDPLGALLERMIPGIVASPRGWGRALLRGRYMAAVARMEHDGIPIDIEMLRLFRQGWPYVKESLIREVDQHYGVYRGTTFKAGLFDAWLAERGIPWPTTPTGRLSLSDDAFKDQARAYPEVEPLRQLRKSMGELRLEKLEVGADGRNRCLLGAFGATTSRNTPSASKFAFGPSSWLRGLIRPGPDRALAYIDYSSQEVAIAAALSGDPALIEAVATGDPYLAFAIRAGLAPPDATRETHGAIRDRCKVCVLGVNYGMGASSLALRIGGNRLYAENLLRLLARTFPVFTRWSEDVADAAELTGCLTSVFGWPLHVIETTRVTRLRNYPMQANGAEMLRLAACLTTEAGVMVDAPVHDALLIEAAEGDISEAAALTQSAMAEASRVVLGGLEVSTDVKVVRWPDRFSDPRGQVMWDRVTNLLQQSPLEGQVGREGSEGQIATP
jgi:hypothetical protein